MLDKTFSPKEVEARLYAQWEESGAFRAGSRPGADSFSIVIPPPNVTGNLHIGHALNNTLQDALARYERMRGKNVLWQPGTDHAGIATQLVVERELAKRQLSRVRMGREAFLAESGSGRRNRAVSSRNSCAASAPPATGAASASPWTRGFRAPC
jgi:valyl-tRNA synthetase